MYTAVGTPASTPHHLLANSLCWRFGLFPVCGGPASGPSQRRTPLRTRLASLQMTFLSFNNAKTPAHCDPLLNPLLWDSHTHSTLLSRAALYLPGKSRLPHAPQSSLNYSHVHSLWKKNSFLTLFKLTIRKNGNHCRTLLPRAEMWRVWRRPGLAGSWLMRAGSECCEPGNPPVGASLARCLWSPTSPCPTLFSPLISGACVIW